VRLARRRAAAARTRAERPGPGGSACAASGLITAAKTVASATTALVAAADGVVNGTHTMEQLVVAAHEVRAPGVEGGGARTRGGRS